MQQSIYTINTEGLINTQLACTHSPPDIDIVHACVSPHRTHQRPDIRLEKHKYTVILRDECVSSTTQPWTLPQCTARVCQGGRPYMPHTERVCQGGRLYMPHTERVCQGGMPYMPHTERVVFTTHEHFANEPISISAPTPI